MERFSKWKKFYLQIACFFTGYEYKILLECSSLSIKKLKKYFSAIIIVSIIWFFVGFNFSQTYIKLGVGQSIIGAIIAVIMIIQIERQIILSIERNRFAMRVRLVLGLIIALLGGAIIDQIIFQDDIEYAKKESDQIKVNEIMKKKTAQLDSQIKHLERSIQDRRQEQLELQKSIAKNPFVQKKYQREDYVIDTTKKKNIKVGGSNEVTEVRNPNEERVKSLDKTIQDLENQLKETEKQKFNLREEVEKEVKNTKGFLNEISLLWQVIISNRISIVTYIMFFLLFLIIELLVVLIKSTSKNYTDYELKIIASDEIKKEQILRNIDANMREIINKSIQK